MTTQWYWCSAPEQITLETIFESKEKFCFLAGSGISLDPPSCLPTGYQFTRTVLEGLIPSNECEHILALMNPEREGMQEQGDFLRFEQLMEYLEYYDPDLRILDCYDQCVTPNRNHLFLAQMLLQHNFVFTTNFDNLIEYALEEEGISRWQIYPVIHRQDWESQPKSSQYYVYKLHGSLVDIRNGKACRESLQVTLTQIARKKEEAFQLEPWKRHIFQSFLQRYDLVVLGYSGLDDFDVMPTLWSISSTKRILWISHNPMYSPDHAQIDVIRTAPSAGSASYSIPDRIGQNLLTFARHQTRQSSQLIRITVHTAQFLEWLWQKYVLRPLPIIDTAPCDGSKFSLPAQLTISEAEKFKLTGDIFYDRHLLFKSLQAYQTALRLSQAEINMKLQATCLNDIGSIYYDQGRMDEALQAFQLSYDIFEQLQDLEGKIEALNSIGRLLHDQGHMEEALQRYQEALLITEQLSDLQLKSTSLTNIGVLLHDQGRFYEAMEYYRQTLDIEEQLGDIAGKAISLHNIGLIHYDQGHLDKAMEYYQQSLAIEEQLGDLDGKADSLINIGLIYYDRGHLDKAMDYYEQALAIAEQLHDLSAKTEILHDIGRVFLSQGHLDEALDYCQQALIIAEQMQISTLRNEIQETLTSIEKKFKT